MFHLKLKDTQCGFKAFNRKAAEILVNKSKIDRFAFDVEYLYIAKLNKLKYSSIPVVWRDEAGSSVKVANASVIFLKDLFVIKKNKKHYFI
jgi:dolichyl-phosphate beta-glucosyltransferase